MNFIWFVMGFWIGLHICYLRTKEERKIAGYTIVISIMILTEDSQLCKELYETIEHRDKEELIKLIRDTVSTEDTRLRLIQDVRSW
jgi:HJR/Mrr/RecB family endonuclease